MTTGIPLPTAASTGSTSALCIERRQHDSVDSGRDRVLHELDLLDPIVFLLWALPDDIDVSELVGGLERAGVQRFPELVGRSLGDDDHPPLLRFGTGQACSARILDLRRMNQPGDLGLVHVLGGDQHLAGGDLRFDGLFFQLHDHRFDGELAHSKRILHDQALDFPVAHRVDEWLAGVETNEDDALAAGV